MLGTAAGPHPFPTIVREFQRMIGEETKAQILEKEGRLPDAVIACVGGTASGRRPSFSRICALVSSPIMRWNSRTIVGNGCGPAAVPSM